MTSSFFWFCVSTRNLKKAVEAPQTISADSSRRPKFVYKHPKFHKIFHHFLLDSSQLCSSCTVSDASATCGRPLWRGDCRLQPTGFGDSHLSFGQGWARLGNHLSQSRNSFVYIWDNCDGVFVVPEKSSDYSRTSFSCSLDCPSILVHKQRKYRSSSSYSSSFDPAAYQLCSKHGLCSGDSLIFAARSHQYFRRIFTKHFQVNLFVV